MTDRQGRPEGDQGQRRQVRRPPLHRPARQVAARHLRRLDLVDEEIFAEGTMFDGSSIAGWKAINESDMILMPDPATAYDGPVLRRVDAVDRLRRPRADHRRALRPRPARHRQEGRGLPEVDRHRRHRSIVGPEAEFFIFDDVQFMADPYNTGFKLDDVELPTNGDTDYEGGNLGHRIQTKGGYFPVPPLDSAQDMRGEMLAAMAADGRQGREAPPRGRLRPARARHEVRHADADGRPDADLQVLHPQRRAELRQDGDLHAEAHLRRQRLGHARATSRSGRTASRSSPATSTPTSARNASGTSAASSSTPRRSTPSPTRRPTATSAWSRATRRRCCSPTRRATARPPAASRGRPRPKAKRVEVRFPDPTANPYLAFAAHADGRPRRHPEQDRSRPGDGQGPLRPAAARAEEDPDRLRLAARGARRASTRTAPSSRPAASSTTTSSTASSS